MRITAIVFSVAGGDVVFKGHDYYTELYTRLSIPTPGDNAEDRARRLEQRVFYLGQQLQQHEGTLAILEREMHRRRFHPYSQHFLAVITCVAGFLVGIYVWPYFWVRGLVLQWPW